ncbi:MAG: AmmeMemoRadiSam system protein A, partial [Actinomycetia bacterium]|nr:AmmeMemoRadiSam system protein A [Actinomycetes bacterium]
SGDLSHRLSHEGPYGFSALGSVFDEKVKEIVASGRLSELLNIDNSLSVPAAECGLRSFVTLAGLLSKLEIETNILSYEGPFGIGYLVASLMVKGKSE